MLFSASLFLRLGYLRPAPRWWLAAFLPFLALLLQQPRSTEASASQNQSSIPGHPPPFLSLPTHPTFFLFIFSNLFFFFFNHQKLQHPTPLGLDPAPLGAPTKPRCIPARSVWAAHTESVRPGSPRASPQEKRTKSGPSFPKGPARLNRSRLIKTWPARPHPPVVCNPCACFWLGNGLGRMGGGVVTTRISGYLFSLPLNPFLPQISPASCLQPTGVDSGPGAPQPQSTGPGFPIHY